MQVDERVHINLEVCHLRLEQRIGIANVLVITLIRQM